jgi:hypothetical protein
MPGSKKKNIIVLLIFGGNISTTAPAFIAGAFSLPRRSSQTKAGFA